MNSRIFKKLTKAASFELDRLGVQYFGGRFEATKLEENYPEVTRDYHWEKKSLERWRGACSRYPTILSGTVGYGQTTGYYEPEWSDSDALSCLFNYVVESFTDWGNCNGDEWPDNHCPEILKKSARHLINYAKSLPDNIDQIDLERKCEI